MKENKNFSIAVQVEPSVDQTKRCHFCQALITTRAGKIGNPDAWAVTGLVSGAIEDLLRLLVEQRQPVEAQDFLARMSTQALFAALYSWRRGVSNWPYCDECPLNSVGCDSFFALPQGTELFDGELAFLIRIGTDESRLIWRDYESRDIRELRVSFREYISEWQAARHLIHDSSEYS